MMFALTRGVYNIALTADLTVTNTTFTLFLMGDRPYKLTVRQTNGKIAHLLVPVRVEDTFCSFHFQGRGARLIIAETLVLQSTTEEFELFTVARGDLAFTDEASRYFFTDDPQMRRNPRRRNKPVLYVTTLTCYPFNNAPTLESLNPTDEVPSIVRTDTIPSQFQTAFECVRMTLDGEYCDDGVLVFYGQSGIGKSFIGYKFHTEYGFNVFETDARSKFTDTTELSHYVEENNIKLIVVGNRPGSETLQSVMDAIPRHTLVHFKYM